MLKRCLLMISLMLLPVTVLAHGDETETKPGEIKNQVEIKARSAVEDKGESRRLEKSQIEPKSADIATKAEQKRKQRCQKATEVLGKKALKVTGHKQNLDQQYTTVENRWQRLIDRAKSAGVDTSKLEASLAEYKQGHQKLNADMDSLRQLQTSTARACGEEDQAKDYKDEMKAAHTKVLQDAKDLRLLRQQTQRDVIVPILKEMAAKNEGDKTE